MYSGYNSLSSREVSWRNLNLKNFTRDSANKIQKTWNLHNFYWLTLAKFFERASKNPKSIEIYHCCKQLIVSTIWNLELMVVRAKEERRFEEKRRFEEEEVVEEVEVFFRDDVHWYCWVPSRFNPSCSWHQDWLESKIWSVKKDALLHALVDSGDCCVLFYLGRQFE